MPKSIAASARPLATNASSGLLLAVIVDERRCEYREQRSRDEHDADRDQRAKIRPEAAEEMRDLRNAATLLLPCRGEEPDGEDRSPDHHRERSHDRHHADQELNHVIRKQQEQPAHAMRRKHRRRFPQPCDSASRRMARVRDGRRRFRHVAGAGQAWARVRSGSGLACTIRSRRIRSKCAGSCA
jgi:hypothetical protein